MSIKINYKGAEILSYDENGTKTLKTGGKYCEGDISITNTQDGGITPTGTIEITENGTYDVTEKASAVVNVASGNPYEIAEAIATKTITYFKSNATGWTPMLRLASSLTFFSMKNCIVIYTEGFRQCRGIVACVLGRGDGYGGQSQIFASCTKLKTLVLNNGVFTINGAYNAFSETPIYLGTGKIFVQTTKVDASKSATNWSSLADWIYGFNEADTYSSSTTYSIGDVCQHNGNFYVYCKADLSSSTGVAPSGDTTDNACWQYINSITA